MTDNEFNDLVGDVIKNYNGAGDKLVSSVGALVVGRYMGWRVLSLVLSQPTYFKNERILGVKFKEVLPERGVYSYKSFGLKIVDGLGNFWKVVRGMKSEKISRDDKVLLE